MRGSPTPRTTGAILAAIAGAAAMGLLPWLGKPAFPDEVASLSSGHLGWTALWQHSHVVDLVLLPYYSLLHLWLQLSAGSEWARLPSLLAFGLTVFLVGRLGARLGGRLCGVIAAIVAATSPLLVSAALSARPYALSALAATAAVAALLRWLEGGRVRWAWWFCAASIATLLLHLFAVLAPLSVLVAAVALEPQRVPWQVARRGRAHRSHRGRSTHLRDPGGEPAESARLDPFPLHGRAGDESHRGTGVRRACPLCPLRAGRRDRDERGMPLGAQSRWPPTRAPRPPAPGAPGGLGRSARGRTGRRFAGEAGVPRPLRDLLGPRPGARPRAARVLGARQDRHPASRAARASSSRTSCWGQRRSSSSSRLRCPRLD